MKHITFNKTFTVDNKTEDWKLMMEHISNYYGKKLYWLPFKFNRYDIQREFHKLEKEGDRNFTHLMNNLTQPNNK